MIDRPDVSVEMSFENHLEVQAHQKFGTTPITYLGVWHQNACQFEFQLGAASVKPKPWMLPWLALVLKTFDRYQPHKAALNQQLRLLGVPL